MSRRWPAARSIFAHYCTDRTASSSRSISVDTCTAAESRTSCWQCTSCRRHSECPAYPACLKILSCTQHLSHVTLICDYDDDYHYDYDDYRDCYFTTLGSI